MAVAGLATWAAAQSIPTPMPFGLALQWGTTDDPYFCWAPQTVIIHARMEALLLAPEQIELAEFFAYLPEAGSSPALKDIFDQTFSLAESFPVKFAKAAWGFGECIWIFFFFPPSISRCGVCSQVICRKRYNMRRKFSARTMCIRYTKRHMPGRWLLGC